MNFKSYTFKMYSVSISPSFLSDIWVTTLISAWSSLTGPPATNNFPTYTLAAHSLPGSQSSLKYQLVVLVPTKT